MLTISYLGTNWPADRFDLWRGSPLFGVNLADKRVATFQVQMSSLLAEELFPRIESEPEQQASLNEALTRYAVRRIEQTVKTAGLASDVSADTIRPLIVDDAELQLIRELTREKTCDYQVKQGRDLFCLATDGNEPVSTTAYGIAGMTSRHLCRQCSLPNTDFVCSHFMHPAVVGIAAGEGGRLIERRLTEAICDLGNKEVDDDPGKCKAGGHPCWKREIPTEESEPPRVSPLELAENLDHLNVVWKLTFRKPLIRVQELSSVTSFALPCTRFEEFKSRVSALADLMKKMHIPDALLEGHGREIPLDQTLNRLEAALRRKLDEEHLPQVAIKMLRDINEIRVGQQHSAAADKVVKGFSNLGLKYPPEDWNETWEQLAGLFTEAIRSIRKALAASEESLEA